MTNDLEIVLSDEFRRSVEENLGRDPVRVALDGRIPHAALVASQVKYLHRAKSKLPSYYAARCIVPPRAFEQSSSEAVAARKEGSGRVAIDLTCGLGVDAWALSRRFERVVAIERDGDLAAIARENFRRLGADNIEVVNSSAEEFLAGVEPGGDHLRADLVYADPDRRDTRGGKMVLLEDCSPDIVTLLPALRRIAPRLVVKLSPMFDVDEVLRIFGGGGTRAEVISLGGECKEIVADVWLPPSRDASTAYGDIRRSVDETFGSPARPVVRAVAIGVGEAEYPFGEEWSGLEVADGDGAIGEEAAPDRESFTPELYRYLVIPDVALQKGRLARRYLSERGICMESDNGYGFAATEPGGIMGRAMEIGSIEPFDPKALKRRLKAAGIRNIDILRRDFPLSAAEIARALGVREGGTTRIAFTRAGGGLWQITTKSGLGLAAADPCLSETTVRNGKTPRAEAAFPCGR